MNKQTINGILKYVKNYEDLLIAYRMTKYCHKMNDTIIKAFQEKTIELFNNLINKA